MQKAFLRSTITDTFVNKSQLRRAAPRASNEMQQQVSLLVDHDQPSSKIEQLIRDTENELRIISAFSKHQFFSDEATLIQSICNYFQSNNTDKKALYIGFSLCFVPEHCLCFPQLRGAKYFLFKNTDQISAVIVDPLYMIQNAVNFAQRIYLLREMCKKNNIPFLIDERKTLARLHRKGLNEIYQFQADGLLLGENISNGLPFGVFAHNDPYLKSSEDWRPLCASAAAMRACQEKAKTIARQSNTFYLQWNELGHALCAAVNRRLSREYPRGVLRNCGSIVWTLNFGCRRMQKALRAAKVIQSAENCIYLPEQPSQNKRIENKIVALLRKKKPAAKIAAGQINKKQKLLQIIQSGR